MSKELKTDSLKVESMGILKGIKTTITFEVFFDEQVSYFSKEVKKAHSDILELMMILNNVCKEI